MALISQLAARSLCAAATLWLTLSISGCGGGGSSLTESAAPGTPAKLTQAATPVAGNVVANNGFETTSLAFWSMNRSTNGGAFSAIVPSFASGVAPGVANTGAAYAFLGGNPPPGPYNEVSHLMQTIVVPSSGAQAKLEFWYNITSDETHPVNMYDTLQIEIINSNTSALIKRLGTLSNQDKVADTTTWRKTPQFDLTPYKGQTVSLRFVSTNDNTLQTRFRIDDVAVFPVDVSAVVPQNGWWWNPLEGGRGFAIERQGYQLYLVAFLYDSLGAPLWLASTMSQQNDGSYTGVFSRFTGGQSLQGAFKQAAATSTPANVAVTFNTATTASITFMPTDNTSERTVAIERFPISSPGFAAASPNVTTGWYWNPAQGGRGFFIETQGTNAFVGSFMYDVNGNPIWYVNSPSLTGGNTLNSASSTYTAGQTLTGNYVFPTLTPGNLGNLAFTFASPSIASLALPGVVTPVAVQNFVFNSTKRLRTVAAGVTKCLEVVNDANKNLIQMATCDGSAGQRWTVQTKAGAGTAQEIINELAGTGKCLDVFGNGIAAQTTEARMQGCGLVSGQAWTLSNANFAASTGASTFKLTNQFTTSARCLSNPNPVLPAVVIENCVANTGQNWELQ